MKKIITALVLTLFIATPSLAYGDTGFHPNGDPQLVTNAWGLTGYETPKVGYGDIIVDEAGYSETCNIFWGCVNLTSLDYYRDARIETARQLVENGFINQFPMFSYWVQFI